MNSSADLKKYKVGFIGGGNLARAIGLPLIKKNIIFHKNVWVSARTTDTLQIWKDVDSSFELNTTFNNADVVINCDIVFLSVKPQAMHSAIDDIKKGLGDRKLNLENKLFITVLAGPTLKTVEMEMQKRLGISYPLKIIRTMPNIPLYIGEGISVISRNQAVTENDVQLFKGMMSHISMTEELPEYLMNAAGGLTASGPAYACLIMEGLADGAVKNGIPKQLAIKFAAQVMVGAGKMIIQGVKTPWQLKDEVCSPGGTTITGIHALETSAVRAALMNAVDNAVKRSDELGS